MLRWFWKKGSTIHCLGGFKNVPPGLSYRIKQNSTKNQISLICKQPLKLIFQRCKRWMTKKCQKNFELKTVRLTDMQISGKGSKITIFQSLKLTQNHGLRNQKSANQNNFGFNLNMSKIKHRKIGAIFKIWKKYQILDSRLTCIK